jgi:hypothetical protein
MYTSSFTILLLVLGLIFCLVWSILCMQISIYLESTNILCDVHLFSVGERIWWYCSQSNGTCNK